MMALRGASLMKFIKSAGAAQTDTAAVVLWIWLT